MPITFDAVYEDGSFKPSEPLPLAPREHVRLAIIPSTPAPPPSDSVVTELTALAQQLFNNVEVLWKSDPEIAGEQFFGFYATASGDEGAIARQEDTWHREVARLAPHCSDRYRLAVFVR